MAANILWILTVASIFSSSFGFPKPDGEGGSRCPGVSCVTAPRGTTCQARYDPSDKCCPTWVCTDGQTAHGSMSSQSTSWKTSDGSSYGYMSGSGFDSSRSVSGGQGVPTSMSGGGSFQQSFQSYGQPFNFGQNPSGNAGGFGILPFGPLFGGQGVPNFPNFNNMQFGLGSMGRNPSPAINAVDVLADEQGAEIV